MGKKVEEMFDMVKKELTEDQILDLVKALIEEWRFVLME